MHVGNLSVVISRGNNEIRFGQLSDGTDRQTLAAYLRDPIPGTVRRYSAPPEVRLIGSANESDLQHLKTAVQMVNASLPDGAKMAMGEPIPDFSLRSTVDANGIWFVSGRERANTIHVEFVPAGQFHSNAGATTWGQPDNAGGIENSYVQFNVGANAYPSGTGDRTSSRQALILLSHELMHALGMDTHTYRQASPRSLRAPPRSTTRSKMANASLCHCYTQSTVKRCRCFSAGLIMATAQPNSVIGLN